MKSTFSKLLGLLFIANVVFSCSSDDQTKTEPPKTPIFKVDYNNFQGTIKGEEIVLEADKVYKLTGKLVVDNQAKLVIPAGTRIEATNGTSYIAVAQGGQIFINGTAEKPVIMTSDKLEKTPGQWGGLVICGKAPINKGLTASAEVSELTYGGSDVSDNSGVITYLRVEYSGFAYNSEKEFNGISFFGVGNGTKVENVEVYAGADDGFEFFGGTVNTKNLISRLNEDDQFDWTEGWSGTNENWFGQLGLGRGNRGIEADNNSNDHLALPIANPVIKNLTLIGLGNQGSESQAIKMRVGTKGKFENVVLSDFLVGFDIQHDESLSYISTGDLMVKNVKFINIPTKAKGKNTAETSVNIDGFFTENNQATGAGNGSSLPNWSQGWIAE